MLSQWLNVAPSPESLGQLLLELLALVIFLWWVFGQPSPQERDIELKDPLHDSALKDNPDPETAYTLVVTDGPDQGQDWKLRTWVLIGFRSPRLPVIVNFINLLDPAVRPTHIVMHWNRELHVYVMQALGPTEIYRGDDKMQLSGPESQTLILLQPDDVIKLGNTVLELRQIAST